MKEIIFVSNFLGNGGAARVISVLAEAFANKKYQVTICYYPYNGEEYKHCEKVKYIKLDLGNARGIKRKYQRIALLRNELKKHKSAVIISFEYFMNMQTIIAAFGLKNRLIVSERNDPAQVGGQFPINKVRNFLYKCCDILVCQTPDAMRYFPQKIQKKTVIIENPIRTELPNMWIGERKHEIVNFCRLEKQKNLELLIDAFENFHKLYEEYTLVIYGDGKERGSIQNYINQKNLQTYVHLYPAASDIHHRILKDSMFVSSSNYEGISNSMIEAMAIGLPTICTDCPCGGARMIIEDGVNGLLIPVGDVAALEKTMSKVASDVHLSNELAKNGQKIKETLSVGNIVTKWEKLLDS